MNNDIISLNGNIVSKSEAVISLKSVALKYAASVFEGIRGYVTTSGDVNVFGLELHLDRLFQSMDFMQFSYDFTRGDIVSWIEELVETKELSTDFYIRCAASIEGEGGLDSEGPVALSIDAFSKGRNPYYDSGCRLKISSWKKISEQSMPPQVKCISNYSNARLGALEVKRDGYDLPLFLNTRDTVSESSTASIFFVKDDVVITPPLSADILDSITRRFVIEVLQDVGYSIQIREIGRVEAFGCDEAFLVGTGAEIIPVTSLDNKTFHGCKGVITNELKEKYFRVIRECDENYSRYSHILKGRKGHAAHAV